MSTSRTVALSVLCVLSLLVIIAANNGFLYNSGTYNDHADLMAFGALCDGSGTALTADPAAFDRAISSGTHKITLPTNKTCYAANHIVDVAGFTVQGSGNSRILPVPGANYVFKCTKNNFSLREITFDDVQSSGSSFAGGSTVAKTTLVSGGAADSTSIVVSDITAHNGVSPAVQANQVFMLMGDNGLWNFGVIDTVTPGSGTQGTVTLRQPLRFDATGTGFYSSFSNIYNTTGCGNWRHRDLTFTHSMASMMFDDPAGTSNDLGGGYVENIACNNAVMGCVSMWRGVNNSRFSDVEVNSTIPLQFTGTVSGTTVSFNKYTAWKPAGIQATVGSTPYYADIIIHTSGDQAAGTTLTTTYPANLTRVGMRTCALTDAPLPSGMSAELAITSVSPYDHTITLSGPFTDPIADGVAIGLCGGLDVNDAGQILTFTGSSTNFPVPANGTSYTITFTGEGAFGVGGSDTGSGGPTTALNECDKCIVHGGNNPIYFDGRWTDLVVQQSLGDAANYEAVHINASGAQFVSLRAEFAPTSLYLGKGAFGTVAIAPLPPGIGNVGTAGKPYTFATSVLCRCVMNINQRLIINPTTVANLPANAAAKIGEFVTITDAASPTIGGLITGGGTAYVPAVSDGTNYNALFPVLTSGGPVAVLEQKGDGWSGTGTGVGNELNHTSSALIPSGTVCAQCSLEIDALYDYENDADTKNPIIRIGTTAGATAGTACLNQAQTTTKSFHYICVIHNANDKDVQTLFTDGSTQPYGTSADAAVVGNIAFSGDTYVNFNYNATAAARLDLKAYTIKLIGPPKT